MITPTQSPCVTLQHHCPSCLHVVRYGVALASESSIIDHVMPCLPANLTHQQPLAPCCAQCPCTSLLCLVRLLATSLPCAFTICLYRIDAFPFAVKSLCLPCPKNLGLDSSITHCIGQYQKRKTLSLYVAHITYRPSSIAPSSLDHT